jgi:hypothetical protein
MARRLKSVGWRSEPVATTPFPLGASGYWVRLSDGHPMFTDRFGVDHDLLA